MRNLTLALLAATCLLLAGCGDDKGGGGGTTGGTTEGASGAGDAGDAAAGGAASSEGVEGTYVIDMKQMEPLIKPILEAQIEMIKKMLPADKADEKVEEMRAEMMGGMTFDAHIREDKSFEVISKGETKAKGTWALDGSKITFTTTFENGKEKDPPEVMDGTFEDGVIRFRPDKDMPFDLIMKKK